MPKITRFITLAVLTVLSLLTEPLNGQTVYPEGIESDRPGQAYSSFAVPVNQLQIQVGSGMVLNNPMGDDWRYTSLAGYVFRFGLVKNLDIQYSVFPGFSATRFYRANRKEYDYGTGYNPELLNFAFRYQLLRGSGMLKAVSIYLEVNAQDFIEGDFTENPSVNNQIRISAKHIATDRLAFTTNVAVGNVHTDQRDYRYVLNMSYNVGENWGVFGDAFGTMNSSFQAHRTDLGAYWLVKPTIQLDAFVGRTYAGDNTHDAFFDSFFAEVGASFRFPVKTNAK